MSSVGNGAGLGSSAMAGSGVGVSGMNGKLVGVGRMVPVGVGKTGWKGVGVGKSAGWKGVAVGLGLGLAVTKVKGREDAAGGAEPQAVRAVKISSLRRNDVRWSEGFIRRAGLCLAVSLRSPKSPDFGA